MTETPSAVTPLPPGATIGILGGGQLGRMLAIAAARLGFRTHIYQPGSPPPASDVAHRTTSASYEDPVSLTRFAQSVDIVTFEFENVPALALDAIGVHVPVWPPREALAASQDRVDEKSFMRSLGIAVAPWQQIDDVDALSAAIETIGTPAILKTRRLGYDGKGQARIDDAADAVAAWHSIGAAPAILEAMVPFRREVSVIAARGHDGAVVCYDPGENVHRDGILSTTTVSAEAGRAVTMDAALIAGRILNALDYVGVIGVELFVLPDNRLLVNEIAPRVHNSGHWTIEACAIDQFEQHIRAIAGWPLGDGTRHSDAVMTNLIGRDVDDWLALAGGGGGVHIYGKGDARPGRKMGHVTRISPKT